jgi:GNAT superfamily N-acetyltransferase
VGHIRSYQEGDAARCCEIILACLPQLDGLNNSARAFLQAKLIPERLHAELAALDCFVYEENHRIQGLAALDGEEAKRLYVDPALQGRGIGRALFAHIETLARTRGLDFLHGEASPSAAPFYQRLGFVVVGPAEFSRGPARFRMTTIRKAL